MNKYRRLTQDDIHKRSQAVFRILQSYGSVYIERSYFHWLGFRMFRTYIDYGDYSRSDGESSISLHRALVALLNNHASKMFTVVGFVEDPLTDPLASFVYW